MTIPAQPIILYFGSGSPFAWKVWLALEHKALPYVAKRLSFDNDDLKTATFTAINPRQRVPAIVDGDFSLYESLAIVEYLEDRYADAGAPLWPRDPRQRAIARRVAAEADSYLYPLIERLLTHAFHAEGATPDRATIDAAKADLAVELQRVESALMRDFFAGEKISAADFTAYPYLAFLGRIDAKRPGSDLSALITPRLRAWMDRVEALPYFQKTYPPHWRG